MFLHPLCTFQQGAATFTPFLRCVLLFLLYSFFFFFFLMGKWDLYAISLSFALTFPSFLLCLLPFFSVSYMKSPVTDWFMFNWEQTQRYSSTHFPLQQSSSFDVFVSSLPTKPTAKGNQTGLADRNYLGPFCLAASPPCFNLIPFSPCLSQWINERMTLAIVFNCTPLLSLPVVQYLLQQQQEWLQSWIHHPKVLLMSRKEQRGFVSPLFPMGYQSHWQPAEEMPKAESPNSL